MTKHIDNINYQGIIRKYESAWDNLSGKELRQLLTPDALFYDMAYQWTIKYDELEDYMGSLKKVCSNYKFKIVRSHINENGFILLQWKVFIYEREKKQNRFLPGVEVLHLEKDKIVKMECYYDANTEHKLIYPEYDTSQKNTPVHRKYIKSGLSPRQIVYYKNTLEQLMEKERLYLKPELSLSELAKQLNLTSNHLSQVINSQFGVNFHAYLNKRRIKEAEKIIKNNFKIGILDVAYQSGFNSISAFYAAFKKATGVTPAAYRKKNIL